jgi:hypothetical protein
MQTDYTTSRQLLAFRVATVVRVIFWQCLLGTPLALPTVFRLIMVVRSEMDDVILLVIFQAFQ